MTLTIPTGDLVGILSDVLPFADPDKESPRHAVRLWWDAAQLHAEAYSGPHWGRSTWDPDDQHFEEHQDSLITKWGSGDAPWSIVMELPDAKEIVKIYKLSGKGVYYTPLHLDNLGGPLRIVRSADSGHSAINLVVSEVFDTWPRIDQVMQLGQQQWQAVDDLRVNAGLLASFGSVRQRDVMRVRFTGPDSPIHVTIGGRFIGAVMPYREPERLAAAPAPAPVCRCEDDEGDEICPVHPDGGGDDQLPL